MSGFMKKSNDLTEKVIYSQYVRLETILAILNQVEWRIAVISLSAI